jgi:two-component system cell cycle sensor histidine kinase/response regulator CckA
VQESAGAITCTSILGEGTSFTIYLPALVEETFVMDADVTPPTPTPRSPREKMSGTILLCEDDAGLRRLAVQVLRRNGFDVTEAESAEATLAARAKLEGRLDMLVSDVVLPEMAGPELAQLLQSDQPDLLVVLMSGTAQPNVIDALRKGTAAFLAKPFKPSELVDQVTELLTQRSRTS